jgi:hypothetical protein
MGLIPWIALTVARRKVCPLKALMITLMANAIKKPPPNIKWTLNRLKSCLIFISITSGALQGEGRLKFFKRTHDLLEESVGDVWFRQSVPQKEYDEQDWRKTNQLDETDPEHINYTIPERCAAPIVVDRAWHPELIPSVGKWPP